MLQLQLVLRRELDCAAQREADHAAAAADARARLAEVSRAHEEVCERLRGCEQGEREAVARVAALERQQVEMQRQQQQQLQLHRYNVIYFICVIYHIHHMC